MDDSTSSLQQAIFTILTGSTDLQAIAPRVYDQVPEGEAMTNLYPYIVLDAPDITWGKGLEMSRGTGMLKIRGYTNTKGNKDSARIGDTVNRLLHRKSLVVTSVLVAYLQHHRTEIEKAADGAIRRVTISFSIMAHR